MIKRIEIDDRAHWLGLRTRYVGCSELAILLGCDPYLRTAYGLAAEKMGRIAPRPQTPSMRRGELLEDLGVRMLREQFPTWEIERPNAVFVDDEIRLIGSPDVLVRDPVRGLGVIDIKSIEPQVFAEQWRDQADEIGELSPPVGHGIQVMGYAYLTGAAWCALAGIVVGHGLDLHLVDIEYRPGVIERAKHELAAFWRMLDAGVMPDPDYGRDADAIREIYRQDNDSELDLTADNELPGIIAERQAANEILKAVKETVDARTAEILHRIGPARRVKYAGGSLTAKTINRREYTVPPTSYRQLRIKPDQVAP